MWKSFFLAVAFLALRAPAWSQKPGGPVTGGDSLSQPTSRLFYARQFYATTDFLDACINSLNSFNSLLKKESYRIKITSLNNPTSSDMGFSLENEVQNALKPLMEKSKNTNTQKFGNVVSSLLNNQSKPGLGKSLSAFSPVFPTLLSLVG
ncbi:MAG TPA: hypothetical protein VFR58_16170, partial [Flavisolibacter sp.]|nr:hypothetical protein [Flavisolibacter sp.]